MKLITVACVNLLLLAKAAKQYVANFGDGDNGITGTVVVDNGVVTIDLDLSDATLQDEGFGGTIDFAECTAEGLAYHIHKIWTYDDNDDRVTGNCSGTYTSGHWDPWQACGGASGNEFCGDGTVAAECIPTSEYVPDFTADPFSAEVGDWSAKYSKIELTSESKLVKTSSSFYEVIPSEMEGQSVVFHCSTTGAPRAFCAPFVMSDTDASETVPVQDAEGAVVANFEGLGDGSMIMLSSDGTITVSINGAEDIPDCSDYEYSIFDAELDAAALGDDCSAVTDQYDPTAQCLPWSNNAYCTDGKLCEVDSYSYNCDFSSNRYSCAPGDLSGKAGELMSFTDGAYEITVDGPQTLIPPVNDLVGKVIGINCPYSASPTLTFLACAPIEAVTDDSTSMISFITAMIVSFVALLY